VAFNAVPIRNSFLKPSLREVEFEEIFLLGLQPEYKVCIISITTALLIDKRIFFIMIFTRPLPKERSI
jgi:hypothetical protein